MKRNTWSNGRSALVGAALLLSSFDGVASDGALVSFTESPAWKHGQEFVNVFNNGDARMLGRFLKRHLSDQAAQEESVDRRVAELLKVRRKYGSVEAMEVSGLSHAAVVNVRSRGGLRDADIILVVDLSNPERLDQLRLVEIPLDESSVVMGASQ